MAVPPSGAPLPLAAAVEVACTFAYTDLTALALAGPAATSATGAEAAAEVQVSAAPPSSTPREPAEAEEESMVPPKLVTVLVYYQSVVYDVM